MNSKLWCTVLLARLFPGGLVEQASSQRNFPAMWFGIRKLRHKGFEHRITVCFLLNRLAGQQLDFVLNITCPWLKLRVEFYEVWIWRWCMIHRQESACLKFAVWWHRRTTAGTYSQRYAWGFFESGYKEGSTAQLFQIRHRLRYHLLRVKPE
jgi:hypothetical protein